jgi:hypothetical protein
MREYNGVINISESDNDYSIYKIYSSDPLDNSIYIGVTANPKQRVYKHSKERNYKRNKNKPLYLWMNDLIDVKLKGKVLFEIIENNLSQEEAFDKEIQLINKCKLEKLNVLNISEGGKGNLGNIPWNKGEINIYSEVHIEKLRLSHLGKVSGNKGNTYSKETKELLSLRNKERKEKNWNNPKKKKVYKYNSNNVLLAEYSCLEEAGKLELVSPTSVGEWCRKEKVPKNGLIYSYKII